MRVEKVRVNKYESGKLLGFADIDFSLTKGGNSCMTLEGFRIFRDDENGGIQLGLPSRETTKNGKKEYIPVLKLDKEDKDSQALLGYLTDEVTREYNKTPDKNSDKNSSQGTVDDDDVPF